VQWFVPVEALFKGRHFDGQIIILRVSWYTSFKLSLRDLLMMMADRGITLTHTTMLRWVQRYLPEFEKRWNRCARPVGGSWRMDEFAPKPLYMSSIIRPSGLFTLPRSPHELFSFSLPLFSSEERAEFFGVIEQPQPLLVVERHRKASLEKMERWWHSRLGSSRVNRDSVRTWFAHDPNVFLADFQPLMVPGYVRNLRQHRRS
jgi:hypothetical protein